MGISNNATEKGDIVVTLTIAAYLAQLEAEVLANPRDKRKVPSVPELARAAGVSKGAMYNLVKGEVKHVNLELLSAVINELQRRGFEVELSDVLAMYPAEMVAA